MRCYGIHLRAISQWEPKLLLIYFIILWVWKLLFQNYCHISEEPKWCFVSYPEDIQCTCIWTREATHRSFISQHDLALNHVNHSSNRCWLVINNMGIFYWRFECIGLYWFVADFATGHYSNQCRLIVQLDHQEEMWRRVFKHHIHTSTKSIFLEYLTIATWYFDRGVWYFVTPWIWRVIYLSLVSFLYSMQRVLLFFAAVLSK